MPNNNIYYGNLGVIGSTGGGGTGSTVLNIQGTQGQLFSVVDGLTGSLMSVNDISGIPILEVFSDDRVVMGTYGATGLIVSGTNVTSGNIQVTGSATGSVQSLAISGGTATINMGLGNFFTLTLAPGATTGIAASGVQAGQTINLRVTQPATAGTVNFSSAFKFPGGIPYTVSATGGAIDVVSFISFDNINLFGSAIKNLS
jgi:hypothetical protein